MNLRQTKAHMKAAYVYADLSYCNRRKVGCVIVKHNPESKGTDRIISIGYNGTPPGEDNCCEEWVEDGDYLSGFFTKSNVIHAEHNAIKKLQETTETGENTILFVTTAPCVHCAERIINFGIKHVVYDEVYRNEHGIEYLREHGIKVEKLTL